MRDGLRRGSAAAALAGSKSIRRQGRIERKRCQSLTGRGHAEEGRSAAGAASAADLSSGTVSAAGLPRQPWRVLNVLTPALSHHRPRPQTSRAERSPPQVWRGSPGGPSICLPRSRPQTSWARWPLPRVCRGFLAAQWAPTRRRAGPAASDRAPQPSVMTPTIFHPRPYLVANLSDKMVSAAGLPRLRGRPRCRGCCARGRRERQT